MLDARPAPAFDIGAGLERNHIAGLQRVRAVLHQERRLRVPEAKAVPGMMRECRAQTRRRKGGATSVQLVCRRPVAEASHLYVQSTNNKKVILFSLNPDQF